MRTRLSPMRAPPLPLALCAVALVLLLLPRWAYREALPPALYAVLLRDPTPPTYSRPSCPHRQPQPHFFLRTAAAMRVCGAARRAARAHAARGARRGGEACRDAAAQPARPRGQVLGYFTCPLSLFRIIFYLYRCD